MRSGKKVRIYSEFAIRMIVFYATMILLLPIILVVTYLFPIGGSFNNLVFMFWAAIAVLCLTGIGTGILFLKRDHLKRRVRPSYRNEFIYLMMISAFGLL
ncbi:MAG TPA: hypothetical protein PLH02_05645, partial [Bacillota bacterium]|nr:hypothetical protein [Bacillota bacterium]